MKLSPAALDLEIRSLNSQPPYEEMTSFVKALTLGLGSNTNFELIETILSLFLKVHGDVIHQSEDSSKLRAALSDYSQMSEKMNDKLDEAVKYCSSVINFIV